MSPVFCHFRPARRQDKDWVIPAVARATISFTLRRQRHLYFLCKTGRTGHRLPILPERLQVAQDSFANIYFSLFQRLARRHTMTARRPDVFPSRRFGMRLLYPLRQHLKTLLPKVLVKAKRHVGATLPHHLKTNAVHHGQLRARGRETNLRSGAMRRLRDPFDL